MIRSTHHGLWIVFFQTLKLTYCVNVSKRYKRLTLSDIGWKYTRAMLHSYWQKNVHFKQNIDNFKNQLLFSISCPPMIENKNFLSTWSSKSNPKYTELKYLYVLVFQAISQLVCRYKQKYILMFRYNLCHQYYLIFNRKIN